MFKIATIIALVVLIIAIGYLGVLLLKNAFNKNVQGEFALFFGIAGGILLLLDVALAVSGYKLYFS